MKKNTIEKIEKEIHEKTKVPQEIKDKIKKEAFTNIVIGLIVILYFIFIVLGSVDSVKNVRIIDLNIFSILFLGTAILLFEIGYRKNDGKLAIYGIESLTAAVFTLFLPYIIFELKEVNNKYYLIAGICITLYYVIKSIIIAVKIRNKHMKNISDIKEIVKKEKTKRRIKEDIEELEEQKGTKENNKSNKNINKERIENKEKKTINSKNVKENKKEEVVHKKRGRPKKSEVVNSKEQPKETDTPKRRGRPRKVVTSND